jgi:TatD DNase family protein
MSSYFVDTHTHLYSKDFNADLESLLKKSIDNQVGRYYMPNIDSTSIEVMLEVEKKWPEQCFPMMGLHPCSVDENVDRELSIVREWLDKRPFLAVGEIGLDLYWDKTHFEAQKKAFNLQLDWALEFDYAVSIHCRSAFDEIYELMSQRKALPRSVFHCFSGTVEQAQRILDLGDFKLGIGGVLTFKNGGLEPIIEHLELKHIVLETDAPYLAPIPFRGKRNEPVYILEVARKIAQLKGISMDEVARVTTENAEYIFKKR